MNDIQHALPLLNFPSFRCFDILLASLLTNLLINFIKFRHMEIPQFLPTILHLYSLSSRSCLFTFSLRICLRVEAISPSSGGVDEFLELSVCHSRGLRLLPLWRSRWARHRGMCPMSSDENSDSLHLQKHNRGWEF